MQAGIESLLVHVQTAYCHSSLGAQIIIERDGDFIYIDRELPLCGLHKLREDTTKNLGDSDLMVYMVWKQNCGYVGYANLAVVCNPEVRDRHCTNLFPDIHGLTNDAWVSHKLSTWSVKLYAVWNVMCIYNYECSSTLE